MDEVSALEAQQMVADQQMATGGIIMWAVLGYVAATWLFRRRRFPHLAAWLLFLGWSALVSFVPQLRQMDQDLVWFYSLRGLTMGLLVASMANFAQLAPRRETPAAPAG